MTSGRIATSDVDPGDPGSVTRAFAAAGQLGLAALADDARRLLADDAVTYRGPGDTHTDRWRLDPVPLVISHDEWATIEAGITQRTALLDRVLADVHGPRELLRSGALPPEVVLAHPGFLRPLVGVRHPGGHQLTTCATDLVCDAEGSWRPVADRTDVPIGAAYALENRSVLNRLLPEVVRSAGVERLAPYVRALRAALRRSAPAGVDEPRIVMLTPGASARTAFEDAQLAAALGLPVVEGVDLSVRDGHLWLRSLDREPTRVDVVLRRVPAWSSDPLELGASSRLAPPGLVEVARRGGVAIVNHLGAGVLENPGLDAYLPSLAPRLLGQELRLMPPRTLWCGDPTQLREALASLGDLVVRPIARTAGREAVDVATLSPGARAELGARVRAHPHRWVAQERVVGPSTTGVAADGSLVDGRVVLRTFTVSGGRAHVPMVGGLARVIGTGTVPTAADDEAGSWSKDTWVLGDESEPTTGYWLQPGPRVTPDLAETVVPARAVENLLRIGRHAERAEATVRLLRALDDRRSEETTGAGPLREVVDRLLRAVSTVTATTPGFHDDAVRADPAEELEHVVVDRTRPGTLAASVERLVTAAQAVRDQLSGDTWPVVTALERQVLGRDGEPPLVLDGARGPTASRATLGPVLTALLAFQGIAAESLVRDPTWRFLEAGRRLERGLQLVGLLRATVVGLDRSQPAVASLLLESVLVSCESLITYRRRYRSRAQLATVLELLLLDPSNPRSLVWQLDRLDEVVPVLWPAEHPARPVATEDALADVRAALGTADLEAVVTPVRVDGAPLADLLAHLDRRLQRAAGGLARQVALPVPARRPLVDERPGAPDEALLA